MNEEQLFNMVNDGVILAKEQLAHHQRVHPFALTLNNLDEVITLEAPTTLEDTYTWLMDQLKVEVTKNSTIDAIAIFAAVSIPAHYKPQKENGIRVHLEERGKRDNKIGGRFLYVPYELTKGVESDAVEVHLYDPIPVAFVPEIF